MDAPLTITRLRERLTYDPLSGVFYWRTAPRNKSELLGRKAGGEYSAGYVTIHIDGRHYQAHRLAWFYMYGRWPKGEIDHRNRIRSDNRIVNLREASHQNNVFNQSIRRSNKSGTIGVAVDAQTQKWRAHITINGRMKSLGRFTQKADAIAARKQAEQIYFGEFAST